MSNAKVLEDSSYVLQLRSLLAQQIKAKQQGRFTTESNCKQGASESKCCSADKTPCNSGIFLFCYAKQTYKNHRQFKLFFFFILEDWYIRKVLQFLRTSHRSHTELKYHGTTADYHCISSVSILYCLFHITWYHQKMCLIYFNQKFPTNISSQYLV